VNMSDELKEHNILKLILIVRFACVTLDVGHPIYESGPSYHNTTSGNLGRAEGTLSEKSVRLRQRGYALAVVLTSLRS
jgi:hypothetical protein